jgi:hypothetical protein
LGQATHADALVYWPCRLVEQFGGLATGELFHLAEATGSAESYGWYCDPGQGKYGVRKQYLIFDLGHIFSDSWLAQQNKLDALKRQAILGFDPRILLFRCINNNFPVQLL